jgi:hypothetical protein
VEWFIKTFIYFLFITFISDLFIALCVIKLLYTNHYCCHLFNSKVWAKGSEFLKMEVE